MAEAASAALTTAAVATPREEEGISLGGRRAATVAVVLLLLRAAAICGDDDAGIIEARGENAARRAEGENTGRNDAIELVDDDDVAADAAAEEDIIAVAPPPLLLHDAAAADAIARRASRDVAKRYSTGEKRGEGRKKEVCLFLFSFRKKSENFPQMKKEKPK